MKQFVTFLLIIIFPVALLSQGLKHNQILTIEDGLSQNLIYCIYQDQMGYIWFGTKDGLNKYDGYEFEVFRHQPGNNRSLSNNNVRAITEDKSGNLWIGTFGGGLNKFNPVTKRFTVYSSIPNDSATLSSNTITGLALEQNESDTVLWISTTHGFNRFNIKTGVNERFFPEQFYPDKEDINNVRTIACDNRGNIWIGILNDGLYRFDYEKKQLSKIKSEEPSEYPVITTIAVNENGEVFAGTLDGIYYYNDETRSLIKLPGRKKDFLVIKSLMAVKGKLFFSNFINPGLLFEYDLNKDSVSVFEDISPLFTGTHSGRIISLLKDVSGNMWIGTNGFGIVKKNFKELQFENYLFTSKNKKKLSFASVTTFYEDENKNSWIGGYGGLDKLNSKTGIVTKAKFVNKTNGKEITLPSFAVFTIAKSPHEKNVLWMSDKSSGIIAYNTLNNTYKRIYGSDTISDASFYGKLVYNMKYDKAGNLWLATNKGLDEYVLSSGKYKHYFYFDEKKGFLPAAITAMFIDFPKGIWIGTSASGLSLFNPFSGKIKRYLYTPGDTNCISSNSIKCITKDKMGNMWIGTNGGGLNKFDSNTNKFIRLTTQSGLPNDVVYGILEDGRGNLWLSTNKGLSKFNPQKLSFKNYDFNDGLQSNEFNTGAYLETSNGKLFFGGIKGVTSFFPEDLKNSTYNPRVVITQFLLFNKPVVLSRFLNPEGAIKLNYKDNVFAFRFASLDYTNPMKNKYAYRLKGFQDKWIYTNASQRMATFTNIDPGIYTFQVKGTNSDGMWSQNELSIPVEIVPPFWRTTVFKIALVLFLIFLLYAFYRRRINHLEAQKRQKEKFTEQLLESQEAEQTRIAKELHDAVGQDLLIIKNLSTLALQRRNKEQANQLLSNISEKSQNTIDEIRHISRNLRPYLIDRLGLTRAIGAMIEDMDKTSNTIFHFHSDSIDQLFPEKSEIQIYRIVQECLNNIIKHSKADEAVITLLLQDNFLVITIKDDGIGMGESDEKLFDRKFGFGLSGIAERVRILNGKFDIRSSAGRGTNIFIKIPVKYGK